MKSFYVLVTIASLFLMSCSASKSNATTNEIAVLESIVKNKNFEIESSWAYPQNSTATQQVLNSGLLGPGNSSSAVNLIGNSNFLRISGDSITSYLPYYGERQMQVNYGGGDGAIQFDGLLEDYSVRKNKNSSYTFSFRVKSKSEGFNCNITIFPNLKSNMILNSTSRFPISYTGNIIRKKD